jgi:hypothetical protein
VSVNCKHCGKAWDEMTLLCEGWSYLTKTHTEQLAVEWEHHMALCGATDLARSVSERVYNATVRGAGCPDTMCGFNHDD